MRFLNYAGVALVSACLTGTAIVYLPEMVTSTTRLGHEGKPPPVPAVVVVVPREAHSVSWFKAHGAERKAKIAWCSENPSVAMQGGGECQEADTAENQLSADAWVAKARAVTGGKW